MRSKKDNLFTAPDKRLTQIHADEKNRDRNNSDANRFDINGPRDSPILPSRGVLGSPKLLPVGDRHP
ncbi:hypothetical protein [Microcoleus sp. AT13-A6]|uniref:hypothetical protein n=1 Tax=Microcoleus sp. AT13-A6 TaxID=2818591 RepID=UPI002FD574B2